jgi:hypothetical protein
MSAHTPGPWDSWPDSTTIRAGVPRPGIGTLVATVNSKQGPDEFAANARLIAAAPDLLAALKDWFADYAETRKGGEDDELVRRTRRAIAKAEAA